MSQDYEKSWVPRLASLSDQAEGGLKQLAVDDVKPTISSAFESSTLDKTFTMLSRITLHPETLTTFLFDKVHITSHKVSLRLRLVMVEKCYLTSLST